MTRQLIHRTGRTLLAVTLLLSLWLPARADEGQRGVVLRKDPVYPELARQMHLGGLVQMSVAVEADGHVSGVTVVSGHPLLQTAATDAVRKWMFTPASGRTTTTVNIQFVAR